MKTPSISKDTVVTTLSLAVGLALLLYLFFTLPFGEVWQQFLGVSPVIIAKYFGAIVFIQLMLSWRWQAVLQSRDMDDVAFWRLNHYRLAGAAISFLTPTAKLGGEPVRALIHHKNTSYSFKESLSTVVIDKTIELTTSGLFFIVGLVTALLTYSISASLQYTIGGIIIFLLLLIGGFFIRMFNGKPFFAWLFCCIQLDRFERLEEPLERLHDFEKLVVDFYEKDTVGLVYTVFISLLSWIGMFFEFYYVGQIIGIELTVLQVFFIFTFVGLAYLFPVPMAVGTLEAGQVSVFSLIGLQGASGLGVSLVVRAKDMLVSAYGLTCLLASGMSIREALNEVEVFTKEVEEIEDLDDIS